MYGDIRPVYRQPGIQPVPDEEDLRPEAWLEEEVLMTQTQGGHHVTQEPQLLGYWVGLLSTISFVNRSANISHGTLVNDDDQVYLQLLPLPILQADDLPWAELSDRHGKVDQGLYAATKARLCIGPTNLQRNIFK